jgi:hypothetical protein
MKFSAGEKVVHPLYGFGIILGETKEIVKAGVNGSHLFVLNPRRSRTGAENYAVKFDKGGPMGWAENSSNDISQLIPVVEDARAI